MRGPQQTTTGNQDRRHPRSRRPSKARRAVKASGGPLHDAMVKAATRR